MAINTFTFPKIARMRQMTIERYTILNKSNEDIILVEDEYGKWVKFEDVKKLIIKLTQDETWNNTNIDPIEGEECSIMLIDSKIKPAKMINGEWTKLPGYPFSFDFNKSDVIKWKYGIPDICNA